MASQPPKQERVVNLATLPIFVSFFTWGFGTGAQNLGRPLFAYLATGNMFLVGILIASNAIPRMFAGPLTGYLTDRFGRKPLTILGPTIRGLTNLGQFFATDYVTFLVLELIGQIGVAMWNTSSSVLLSDVTANSNRGRALALRHMSTRMGFVAGPLVGGVLAASFGLSSLFLFNALTKIVIIVVILFKVSETRPETERRRPAPTMAEAPRRRFSLEPFRDRSFIALAAATIGLHFTQTGVLQTMLPVHAADVLALDTASVGFLLTLAPTMAFVFAYPNGMLADRLGRKASLVPGLVLLAAAAFTLNIGSVYSLLVFAMVLQGIGESMTLGTTQTYAMDLAPERGRGTYLGMWTSMQAVGSTAGPLVVAGLYHFISPSAAFLFLVALLGLAALLMATLGRETGGTRRTGVL